MTMTCFDVVQQQDHVNIVSVSATDHSYYTLHCVILAMYLSLSSLV